MAFYALQSAIWKLHAALIIRQTEKIIMDGEEISTGNASSLVSSVRHFENNQRGGSNEIYCSSALD